MARRPHPHPGRLPAGDPDTTPAAGITKTTPSTTSPHTRRPVWPWLLIANLAAAFYSVGTVWLAQLNWQLWRYVGQPDFGAYHVGWWHGIWWAIFPVAGVAFLGVCAQLRWRPPNVPSWTAWAALSLQVITYLGTAFWWGPGQGNMHQALLPDGSLDPYYAQLVDTNWIRVALLTLAGALQAWMAARALTAPHETLIRQPDAGAKAVSGHSSAG